MTLPREILFPTSGNIKTLDDVKRWITSWNEFFQRTYFDILKEIVDIQDIAYNSKKRISDDINEFDNPVGLPLDIVRHFALQSIVMRGPPANNNYDYDITSTFTTAGSWATLDCSAIVPADAKIILIRVSALADTANLQFCLRTYGHTNVIFGQEFILRCQIVNQYNDGIGILQCDSLRRLEYLATSGGTWTQVLAKIIGWGF